jgi:hypothetical protein
MAKLKFKRSLLQTTSPLEEKGYQLDTKKRGIGDIDFMKFPIDGIRCEISIQLKQHFIAPVRNFDVMLFRIRTPDFSEGDPHFSPLNSSLPYLMKHVFNKEIFPEGKFFWTYTDEHTLLDEASHAVSLLVEYGIGWLDDPGSNMEWFFDQTPDASP